MIWESFEFIHIRSIGWIIWWIIFSPPPRHPGRPDLQAPSKHRRRNWRCPGESLSWWLRWDPRLHPGRLTWNLKMMVWKMIFLFNWVIFRFHVNLPGCIWTYSNVLVLSLVYALWVYACTGNQIVITQFSLLGTASQKSRSCLLAAYIMIFLSWEITIWDGTVGREVEQQEKLQKLEREHQETWIAESAAIWLWWRYGNCIIMVQL